MTDHVDRPEREPAGLGALRVRFASRLDAERVGHYELARIFAGLPTTPLGEHETEAARLVHDLAVTAGLAKLCTGWIGLHIHTALTAGVTVAAVATAAGLDRQTLEHTWRTWADAQVALRISSGWWGLERADYDRVAGRFTGHPSGGA